MSAAAVAFDVSIILPTYNERDNICDLIDVITGRLAATTSCFEILVMDDNSPDGTAQVVTARYGLTAAPHAVDGTGATGTTECSAAAAVGKGIIRLCVRTQDKGLAQAIRAGLERAQGHTLVVMDTDFNHDPAMIPQMVDLLRYYDLVIGSRFVMRGGMEDKWRYRASLLYNFFIRVLFATQIQDNLSGFFAVRRDHFLQLTPMYDRIFFGYGDYFIRLLLVAWRQNWKILEVPVFYILRRHGDSKTGFWSIFCDYTKAVLKLRFWGL
ncbi:MAG: glycosyltransferase [Caldilineaceae bacterium]